MKRNDLSGATFGKLKVVAFAYRKKGLKFWECLCECGNKTFVKTNNLNSGKTKSCGCKRTNTHLKPGDVYGKLTLKKRHYPEKKSRMSHWVCECECGNETIKDSQYLYKRPTPACEDCGAKLRVEKNTKHGEAPSKNQKSSREYRIWSNMMKRCYSKNLPGYEDYGGRGITVAESWRKSFINFLRDMGRSPKGHSLDRIDNNKGYSPENCRWSSHKEQGQNRRNCVYMEFMGHRKALQFWSDISGLKRGAIDYRRRKGESIEEIFAHFESKGKINMERILKKLEGECTSSTKGNTMPE